MQQDMNCQIEKFRRFTRFYTRRIGTLRKYLLNSPYSFVESRIIWELANNNQVTATYLARYLELDMGYLSRIVRNLSKNEVVKRHKDPNDKRNNILELTEKGQAAYEDLNRSSIQQVEGILAGLSPEDQKRLVSSMQTVETLLSKP